MSKLKPYVVVYKDNECTEIKQSASTEEARREQDELEAADSNTTVHIIYGTDSNDLGVKKGDPLDTSDDLEVSDRFE